MYITRARRLLDIEGVAEAIDGARCAADRRGTQDVTDSRLNSILPGLADAHDEWRKRKQQREIALLAAKAQAARIESVAIAECLRGRTRTPQPEHPARHLLMEGAL